MYLAYALCVVGSAVSIFYIILYGHLFGVDVAKRWVVSMAVALLESLFIIEPMKVSSIWDSVDKLVTNVKQLKFSTL